MSLVGAKFLRKEDPKRFTGFTGRGQFVDDIGPADSAWMAFAMS